MAFKDYQLGVSLADVDWIGFRQFKLFFMETNDFGYILRNTLCMNIISITLNTFLAVSLAILLKELHNDRFAKIVQTISFFPCFISWVIIFSIIQALFAINSGAINQTLVKLGIIEKGLNILGEPKYAWGLMILSDAWKWTGNSSIIYISAIAGIPIEQYESAHIDGAGRFARIFHITLPNLMPTIVVLLIINSGGLLGAALDKFLLFTNSMNWEYMEVFPMYIYNYGIKLLDFSYATSVDIINTFASILILLCVNAIAKKTTGRGLL
jgi:putative aldouronate transport system permease protein